ncbi:MAG: hypothetical protein ACRDL5_15255, partial [Solirubrobacteraceae bacterium]
SERGLAGGRERSGPDPIVLSADKLARGRRWLLSFDGHDLDVERAGKDGGARYQELLYESNRFELADGIAVEVAAPEDLVHYDHVRRTGLAPEFRVVRASEAQPDPAPDAPPPLAADPVPPAPAMIETPELDADETPSARRGQDPPGA